MTQNQNFQIFVKVEKSKLVSKVTNEVRIWYDQKTSSTNVMMIWKLYYVQIVHSNPTGFRNNEANWVCSWKSVKSGNVDDDCWQVDRVCPDLIGFRLENDEWMSPMNSYHYIHYYKNILDDIFDIRFFLLKKIPNTKKQNISI